MASEKIHDLVPSSELPLCVDVDGSLLRTDLLFESVCGLLRSDPLAVRHLPGWLSRGKAHLKRQLSERVSIDVSRLPYNEELVRFLRAEQERGRKVYLASASDLAHVQAIADHLGFVSGVFASDGETNLSGSAKRDRLNAAFGRGGYCYVGNDEVDVVVWQDAGSRIVVSSDTGFVERVRQQFEIERVFPGLGTIAPKALLRALRVHQWVKNLLLFIPALMAHRVFEVETFLAVIGGFVAFSACASSVYILNDLVDLEADRAHRSKSRRPFANGTLPISVGFACVPTLLVIAGLLCLALPAAFAAVLVTYYAITVAYSFALKRIALLDIITLALLYAIRVVAGGCAAGVTVSQWLLAFSLFMFVSLAAVKRFSELYSVRAQNRQKPEGRGYYAEDLEQIAQFGSASGYISVLVMALYVSSADVTKLYAQAQVLWLVCPVILYWISRVWLLAHRGQMDEDPIVFALRDRASYVVAAMILGLIFWAL